MIRKLRRLVVVAGSGIALAALPLSAFAAKPTAHAALELSPVQKDVQFEKPAKDQLEKCALENLSSDAATGFLVRDPSGQILRRFLDTNKDNRLDQWCYYRDGIEVYRDLDTDFNGKADQYRWLGTAGIRWGLDENEDGRIDRWRMISPEEVSAEVVAALRDKDADRFQRLLLTSDELKALGLGDPRTKELSKKIEAASAKFADLAAKQKQVSAKTEWTNFGATHPGVFPAGTDGATKDLIVYENVAAMIDTDGKNAQITIGTLIQVGQNWRVIDLPSLDNQLAGAPAGTFFAQSAPRVEVAANADGGISPEMQKHVDELDALEKKILKAQPDALPDLYAERANLHEQLYKLAARDEDRTNWLIQLADSISAAVQAGGYPDGVDRLRTLAQALADERGHEGHAAYVRFRYLAAVYDRSIQDPQADAGKVQDQWLKDLEQFVTDHAAAPITAEALQQLGSAQEIGGKEQDAITSYTKIVDKFADSEHAKRAAGAKRRLESVGRTIELKGNTLDGKPFDLTSLRGQTVLIHYWATWSDLCQKDVLKVKELQAKYARQKLAVVGVCLDGEAKTAAAFVKSNKIVGPQLFEPGGIESRLANELGISMPMMMLLDSQGRVLNRNLHSAELDAELAKVFKEPGGNARNPATTKSGSSKK